jgi:hypothetical protein
MMQGHKAMHQQKNPNQNDKFHFNRGKIHEGLPETNIKLKSKQHEAAEPFFTIRF